MVGNAAPNSPRPSSRDYICSESLGPGIISTTMGGYVTAEICEQTYSQFADLLVDRLERIWVINVTNLNGFDARAVGAGAVWFEAYKQQGGTKIIFVSKSRTMRMAAQALGFSVGVGVRCVETQMEALRVLGLEER